MNNDDQQLRKDLEAYIEFLEQTDAVSKALGYKLTDRAEAYSERTAQILGVLKRILKGEFRFYTGHSREIILSGRRGGKNYRFTHRSEDDIEGSRDE